MFKEKITPRVDGKQDRNVISFDENEVFLWNEAFSVLLTVWVVPGAKEKPLQLFPII